jgi:hypothetical protein
MTLVAISNYADRLKALQYGKNDGNVRRASDSPADQLTTSPVCSAPCLEMRYRMANDDSQPAI